jgi:hypothetical protein
MVLFPVVVREEVLRARGVTAYMLSKQAAEDTRTGRDLPVSYGVVRGQWRGGGLKLPFCYKIKEERTEN